MTIELSTFANGDTNYIGKHNADNVAIKAAIDALQEALGQGVGGATSGLSLTALFGNTVALIGSNSYTHSEVGAVMTISSGYAWRPSLQTVVQKGTSTPVDFTGQPADTYYILIGADGTPSRTTDPTEAAYSVVWSGAAFTSVTRLARIAWNYYDDELAQDSSANGPFDTLDDRLEAIEAGTSSFFSTRHAVALVGNTNETLDADDSNAIMLEFSGALTVDVDVTLNTSGPRVWCVKNSTTGAFRLTLKAAAGSGVKIPRGPQVWIAWDGTNVLMITQAPDVPTVLAVTYAASLTLDWALADVITITLTGNVTLTLSGAVNKQRLILELTQDGTGGRTVTFGSEVRFGTDITSVTLTTTASKTDKIGFIYDATAGRYDVVALAKGF